VIKDPAEYNAYVAAVDPAKDANAQNQRAGSVCRAVSQQRDEEPGAGNSDGAYQQANNMKKTMETATKLVTADACNVRGLALLAYFDRVLAQSAAANDPNAQLLADGKKYGQQGWTVCPRRRTRKL
jgi:hypothetical protein